MTQNNDQRYQEFCGWINTQIPMTSIEAIKGDASFRRYYRIKTAELSVIAVDAPPHVEDNPNFVTIARELLKAGLRVPEILYTNFEQGFLLVSDLGDTQLLEILNCQNVNRHYHNCFLSLVELQACQALSRTLPHFSQDLLHAELMRFPDWYLTKYLGLNLVGSELSLLCDLNNLLITSALNQPAVCVHRDYHSRNIMLLADDEVGLLDFQDAVLGPLTYDLVSLLRDCYINWPIDQVYEWAIQYRRLAGIQVEDGIFIRWFDWMGMQRHLKVLGIFSRLYLRDCKASYLQDIPRILNYILEVCERYPEFSKFQNFLVNRVLPYESNDISSRQGQAPATSD